MGGISILPVKNGYNICWGVLNQKVHKFHCSPAFKVHLKIPCLEIFPTLLTDNKCSVRQKIERLDTHIHSLKQM